MRGDYVTVVFRDDGDDPGFLRYRLCPSRADAGEFLKSLEAKGLPGALVLSGSLTTNKYVVRG